MTLAMGSGVAADLRLPVLQVPSWVTSAGFGGAAGGSGGPSSLGGRAATPALAAVAGSFAFAFGPVLAFAAATFASALRSEKIFSSSSLRKTIFFGGIAAFYTARL